MLSSILDAVEWSTSSLNSTTTVVVAVLVILVSALIIKRRQDNALGEVPKGLVRPPCLPWLPFVGSAPFMMTNLSDLFGSNLMLTLPVLLLEKSKKLGSVVAFYSMSKYTVVLTGRKTIHEALVKKAVAFADREPFAADILLTNPHRNGITACQYGGSPTKRRNLTLAILKDLGYGKKAMELRIQDQAVEFLKGADKYQGKPFDPTLLSYHFVAGVIFAVLFGRRFETNEPLVEQLKLLNESFFAINAVMYNMVPPMRLLPAFRKLSKSYIVIMAKMFELIKKEVSSCISEKREESFTYKYAEKEGFEAMKTDEFLFIIRDLLLGATETTLQSMRWMMKLLANHKDVQRRVQTEVDEICGGSHQRLPSYEDAGKMPYTSATLLEVMRAETLAPLGVPHQTKSDTDVDGYFIPKGTMVFLSLHSAHMDPDENWEKPEEFNPDRFLDSDGQLVKQDQFMAFSLGKRACIGENLARTELFLFMTSLMRYFNLLPPEGQSSIVTERVSQLNVQPSTYTLRMIRRPEVSGNIA